MPRSRAALYSAALVLAIVAAMQFESQRFLAPAVAVVAAIAMCCMLANSQSRRLAVRATSEDDAQSLLAEAAMGLGVMAVAGIVMGFLFGSFRGALLGLGFVVVVVGAVFMLIGLGPPGGTVLTERPKFDLRYEAPRGLAVGAAFAVGGGSWYFILGRVVLGAGIGMGIGLLSHYGQPSRWEAQQKPSTE